MSERRVPPFGGTDKQFVFSAEDPAPIAHATYPMGPRPSRHGRNARRSTLQLTQKGPLSNGPNTVGLLRGVAEGLLKPGFMVTSTVPGADCDRDSLRVRVGLRCSAPSVFYDPCWAEADRPMDPAVICLIEPWSTEVHRLLTAVVVPPQPATSFDSPWWVELTDHQRCPLATGARSAIGDAEEDVVDYACGDPIRLGLLRGFDRTGPVWMARAARYQDGRFKRAGLEPILTAWF